MMQNISGQMGRVWSLGTREVLYVSGATDDGMRTLASDSRISSIEANLKLFPQTSQTSSSFPLFTDGVPVQLDRIDQRKLPLDKSYSYSTTASNVMVVIPDSGIDVYGDMGGPPPNQGSDDFCTSIYPNCSATRVVDVHDCVASANCSYQVYPVPSGYPPGSHPTADCLGHGSEVADVAGGNYAGVAKGVLLSAAIVTYSCNTPGGDVAGSEQDLADGIDYFVQKKESQPNTPYVMIISESPESISPVVDGAVQKALAANIAVVVAAGDIDGSTCTWSPADLATTTAVISVSATDATTDERISGNATGNCVTLFAPGNPVTWHYPYNAQFDYMWPTGTSFSAPVVGGIAALYLSTTPAALPSEVKAAIVYYATSGVLPTSGAGAIGAGSPNLLAYSFIPAGAPPGWVPPSETQKAKAAVSKIISWLINSCKQLPAC